MKEYEFPYFGSGGKGDTWEGSITIVLSDEEDMRLRRSAESDVWFRLSDDPGLSDICEKILEGAYEQEINNLLEWDDRIDEFREEYMEEDDPDNLPIEIILRRFLDTQGIGINYPDELNPLLSDESDHV